MIRILANDGIDEDAQTLLEEAGYEVITEKVAQDDLAAQLPGFDVIIVRSATKVRESLIDKCPDLKIIARAGVGLDNIDHEYAESKGITVINTPAASSQSVAELAFAHMFSLARFVNRSNRELTAAGSDFKKLKNAYSEGFQLRGKTLAIIGFGRIGRETARIGLALGMKVLPVDLAVDSADIGIELYDNENISLSVKIETVDMETALGQCDFLTIHVPALKGALITKKEIAKMKDTAIVINTARGGIIDEADLLEALNNGRLGGAGIDVFDNEPTPNAALLQHERVSVTPHIGAATVEAQRNIGLELADRILAHFGDDK
ncbi:MAG: D-2-hydroxyacid dehydrogenase [Saprospiraceae bacterium]